MQRIIFLKCMDYVLRKGCNAGIDTFFVDSLNDFVLCFQFIRCLLLVY